MKNNNNLRYALQRIANSIDSPNITPVGPEEFGLHCGVEDFGCSDRYDGATYGYETGMESCLEWAVNEARSALSKPAPAPVCYAVWNCECGETTFFYSLDEYEKYAEAGGTGSPQYCAWEDTIYQVEPGKNIFECETIEHCDFKESIS